MTRKIKQFLYKIGLKPLRLLIKYGVLLGFYIWIWIKKIIRLFGIPAIIVNYDMSKIKGIESKVIESVKQSRFPIIPMFDWWERIQHFDHTVYTLPQGKIFGSYTIATHSNEILWDVTRRHNFHKGTNPYSYRLLPWKVMHLTGSTAILTWNDTDKNYHHRITTIIPKYYIYKKSDIHIDRYLVDFDMPFHQEGWKALWLDKSIMLPSDPKKSYKCDKIICTNTTTIFGIIQPWAKEFVCETFLKNIEPQKSRRKIYIKRITNRKILNEKEFETLIFQYGFEIHVMEGMNIAQQAKLFYESNVIIWPHGAGLTNIIFCQSWTKIMELFHPQTIFGHYYAMAWSMWFEYFPLVWRMKNDITKIEMDNDIIVDIDQLKEILEKVLKK